MKRIASLTRSAVAATALALALGGIQHAHAQQPAAAKGQEQRIQQIEDQLLDLQGIIGTLQSLARNPTASQSGEGATPMVAPPPTSGVPGGGASGDLAQRVDVIETQIRALSGQMEQISSQLTQIQASLGNGQPVQQGQQPPGQQFQPNQQLQPGQPFQQQQQPQVPQQRLQQQGFQQPQPQQPPAPGQIPQQGQFAQPGQVPQPGQQQASLGSQNQENPATRAAYEEAYSHMLRRDFASAEAGFSAFIASHPNDPLAGNAQYWLGETYYVRGDFRKAAASFLTGYRKYRDNDKAPANLLKLGMSLNQLGQKDDACATFSELSTKFPNAPQHLKQRADSERQRAGC